MASEIGNTQLDYTIPELWAEQVLAQVYQEQSMVNRVDRVDGEVAAFGDILHLSAMPTVSVNDVSAAGAVTNQQLSTTEAQLTVDKWKEATVEIVDKASAQSKFNAVEGFKAAFPGALMQQMEIDLLSLYSDVTTNVEGDGLSPINEDLITAAIGDLLSAKFGAFLRDPNRVTLELHTSQWAAMKKIAGYNHANLTGSSVGGQLQFPVPDVYGVPVLFNTQVQSSSSIYQNLLHLREAFAIGIQRNIQSETLARTALTTRITAHCLYGVKTRAQARAVLIKTK